MVDQHFPKILRQPPDSLHPDRVQQFVRLEWISSGLAVLTMIVRHGLNHDGNHDSLALGTVPFLALSLCTVSLICRYRWSLTRVTFRRVNLFEGLAVAAWLIGLVLILLLGPRLDEWIARDLDRATAVVWWSELVMAVLFLVGIVVAVQHSTTLIRSPALLLVLSFALLICVGTLMLMLPRSRTQPDPDMPISAPFTVALFTSTSASCVTGLVVVPTGSYWSSFGQSVILCLFQIGGLGIMTWGALFAVVAGQQMGIREAATFREMLESDNLSGVRQLLMTILTFTLVTELVGAVALSGLWSDRPFWQQVFFSVFHSVSAFCNAGFSLQDDGFLNQGGHWQVWGPLTLLIVFGGLGFAVLQNVWMVSWTTVRRWWSGGLSGWTTLTPNGRQPARVRLNITALLCLSTTIFLLFVGSFGFFLLESTAPTLDSPLSQRIADAWFQSVTFRTAGFNTVDHGELQTGTKFFAIPLMFIGASPGSTGGGVKTIAFALLALTVISILRGKPSIEIRQRTIPTDLVNRALAVMVIGMIIVLTVTLLLVLFERQPDRFLDHLYEATSALATVGVSTGVTPELSVPSRLLLVLTMFVGRLGPLTMLMAVSRPPSEIRYSYPVETVSLG